MNIAQYDQQLNYTQFRPFLRYFPRNDNGVNGPASPVFASTGIPGEDAFTFSAGAAYNVMPAVGYLLVGQAQISLPSTGLIGSMRRLLSLTAPSSTFVQTVEFAVALTFNLTNASSTGVDPLTIDLGSPQSATEKSTWQVLTGVGAGVVVGTGLVGVMIIFQGNALSTLVS
jgi:hypothetical protein